MIEDARLALNERIRKKRAAYQQLFLVDGKPGPNASVVLDDLKRFCGMREPGLVVSPVTKTTDPYATVYRAALRDVYNRIVLMTGLDGASEEVHSDDRPHTADSADPDADP